MPKTKRKYLINNKEVKIIKNFYLNNVTIINKWLDNNRWIIIFLEIIISHIIERKYKNINTNIINNCDKSYN